MNHKTSLIPRAVSRDQAKDTGMAMTLICLLVAHFGHRPYFVLPAIVLLVLTMAWPTLFHYPAKLWFGLAHIMGTVMSKVLLTLLFYGLVTPLGLIRRLGGYDPMRRRKWKNGDASVFKTREHRYRGEDIEAPY
ncbi:MAG: hypothetical protein Kow0099_26010 [Candidatus Abyssubacteria bacterium]